ncbi:MAG: DUF3761 domain-containing protein [Terracidiphilus sp.]
MTALLTGLLASQLCLAQAPAGAPAGATGVCKDGTYTSAASKSGACRGHQGVKTWFAAPAAPSSTTPKAQPAPAPAANSAPAPAPTPAPAPPKKSANSAATPAPGGGAGQVWLNTASNVYHCPGSRYYGTTKAGAYMTEAEAKAKGAKPDHGKACGN